MNELKLPPQVTPNAFAQIRAVGGDDAVLRVAVDGGGCSGFQYRIELDAAQDDDLRIEGEHALVVIDPVSLPFLTGALVDFKTDLMGARFVIDNPNAASQCGCGTSFSI